MNHMGELIGRIALTFMAESSQAIIRTRSLQIATTQSLIRHAKNECAFAGAMLSEFQDKPEINNEHSEKLTHETT